MSIPVTLEQAVYAVISWSETASQEEVKCFLDIPKDRLILFHHTLGQNIRNEFKLWYGEGSELREDCCQAMKSKEIHARLQKLGVASELEHADLASMIIIEAVWDKLHKNLSVN